MSVIKNSIAEAEAAHRRGNIALATFHLKHARLAAEHGDHGGVDKETRGYYHRVHQAVYGHPPG
jgi:hypothetical protein